MAERIPAWLGPDGQAMWLAADLYLVDGARGRVAAIDDVVEPARQPEIFAVGADIAHVGTAAAGNRPGLHDLAGREVHHRDAALAAAAARHLLGAPTGDLE